MLPITETHMVALGVGLILFALLNLYLTCAYQANRRYRKAMLKRIRELQQAQQHERM